jgi:hypothetical protein
MLGVKCSICADHGSGDTRSGLRVDLGAFVEPTVFSNEWTCGTTLKPTTATGRTVEDVVACRVPNEKRDNVGRAIPGRGFDWHFFEKRSESDNCETLVAAKLQKRHGPDEDEMAAPKAAAQKPSTPAASGPGMLLF